VKKGNEKKAKIKALVKALKSDSLKNWLKTRFKGSVIAYDGK
ncbi:MAG TPA: metal ABC transporter substrate-binding protein, partial [Erysipelotrichaceae bacterium]|nr:metal ABC transporter substrate-binding protein [Erysipelotrichaceae bacterium]